MTEYYVHIRGTGEVFKVNANQARLAKGILIFRAAGEVVASFIQEQISGWWKAGDLAPPTT